MLDFLMDVLDVLRCTAQSHQVDCLDAHQLLVVDFLAQVHSAGKPSPQN